MNNYRHGHGSAKNQSGTYRSWAAMKRRCDNPNVDNYRFYGARCISYDGRWTDFRNFLADMGERPAGTTLDRQDGTKDYSKDNCQWATKSQQSIHTAGVKLTPRDITLIRGLLRAKHPRIAVRKWARLVAPSFKVSDNTIRAIANGQLWKGFT